MDLDDVFGALSRTYLFAYLLTRPFSTPVLLHPDWLPLQLQTPPWVTLSEFSDLGHPVHEPVPNPSPLPVSRPSTPVLLPLPSHPAVHPMSPLRSSSTPVVRSTRSHAAGSVPPTPSRRLTYPCVHCRCPVDDRGGQSGDTGNDLL